MRKLSYVLAAIALAVPFITSWGIRQITIAHELGHGFAPEGKGFFGLIVLGLRVMLCFSILALISAAAAYRNVGSQKTSLRQIELLMFCLPVAATVWLSTKLVPTFLSAIHVLLGIKFF